MMKSRLACISRDWRAGVLSLLLACAVPGAQADTEQLKADEQRLAREVGQLQSAVEAFALDRSEVARHREADIAMINAHTVELTNNVAGTVEGWKLAKDPRFEFYTALQEIGRAISQRLAERDARIQAGTQAIQQARSQVGANTASLGQASGKLALLGTKKTHREQLEFLASYSQSVREKLRKLQKESNVEGDMAKTASTQLTQKIVNETDTRP